jgi:HEAT repeat protein/tetratricopeptide repeat protein
MLFKGWKRSVGGLLVALAFQAGAAAAAAPDSARLGRAKDYIADEQWTRAIAELRAVVADPKDKSRDEALYWLAHSLNQAGDSAAAITTIRRLEREYPTSLWVKPAGSLRVDIAVHLQRSDVLWWMAVPPAPPAPVVPAAPRAPSVPPAAPTPPVFATPPAPAAPPVPPPPPARGHRPLPPPAAPPVAPAFPTPPVPPGAWLPEEYRPDADIRIQALDRLMVTDATRVIPILKQIVLASENTREASRALFVLAQSGKPEARKTVVQVAMLASEPVRIAAVKELGRFGGPDASQDLMRVYANSDLAVKMQVVTSLGERAERTALLQIAKAEKDPSVKATAIVTAGQAGGPEVREQLRLLYKQVGMDAKRPIILGLFSARAEDELIRIADEEKDPQLRAEALMRLRLLGTTKAKAYLQKADGIR